MGPEPLLSEPMLWVFFLVLVSNVMGSLLWITMQMLTALAGHRPYLIWRLGRSDRFREVIAEQEDPGRRAVYSHILYAFYGCIVTCFLGFLSFPVVGIVYSIVNIATSGAD
jgi:hypothetical protein